MWFIQSTKSVPETLGPKSYNDLVLLPNNSAGVFFTWEANQKPTLFKLSHASNPEPAEYFCWFVYLEPKSLIVAPKPIVSCPKTRRASHCGNALKASKKPTEHKIMQSLFRRSLFLATDFLFVTVLTSEASADNKLNLQHLSSSILLTRQASTVYLWNCKWATMFCLWESVKHVKRKVSVLTPDRSGSSTGLLGSPNHNN